MPAVRFVFALFITYPGLLLVAQVGTHPITLTLDESVFQSRGTECLDISHPGTDLIAEFFDSDDEVTLRAGSWLGRDSRFLLPEPGPEVSRIELRRLSGAPLAEVVLQIEPCPADATGESINSLIAAQSLRLARYQGQAVHTADIQAHFQQALDTLKELPLLWQAIVHYELATFLRGLGELTQADRHFAQAHEFFETANAGWGQARALNGRGLVAWHTGNPDQAWIFFDQALQWWEAEGNGFETATIYNNMGLLLTRAGQLEEAAHTLELALDHFQGPMDLRLELTLDQIRTESDPSVDLPAALTTLNNLARVERILGRAAIAERYWRTYIALGDLLPQATVAAQAQLNLGDMLFQHGRIDEALTLLIDAQAIFENSDARIWNAHALNVLGQIYLWLGDDPAARKQFQRAERLGQSDASVRATSLTMLGTLNIAGGSYGVARRQLEQAKSLYVSSQAFRNIRELEARLVELDCAEQRHQMCLELTSALLDSVRGEQGFRLVPALQSRLGELHFLLNLPEQAERLLEQALAAQIELNDRFEQLNTLERLSRLYRAQGHPDEISINQRAIDLVEGIQQGHLPPMRRAEFLAIRRSVYDRQIKALLGLDRVNLAWEVAERARGRSLRELRLARQRGLDNPRRESLLNERASLIAKRFVLTRSGGGHQDLIHEDEIDRIGLQLDRIEAELQRLETPPRASSELPELSAVQADLGARDLLLSYYVASDWAVLWVVRADAVEMVELGETAGLEHSISDLASRLRHPRQGMGAIVQSVRNLRRRLVEPSGADLSQASNVYIQPDGPLHSFPFALLSIESEDAWPTLTQTLSWKNENEQTRVQSVVRSRVILADPAWAAIESSLDPYPENSLLSRLVRDQSAGRLPGTRREAEAIAALGSDSESTNLRLGTRATREFVINGGLTGYQLIHLAMHGLVDLQYPEFSALLLASETALGPAFLRPHEIAELDLHAELVVLSGCETGHGKVLAGEGTLSLARPFLIAGARQVVSSLWKIDDHRTAEFMQRFYQHLLNDGDSAARALSRAQNWMRRQPGTAHPYYWAGFILIQA